MHRYVVWQEDLNREQASVPDRLGAYPGVSILRTHGPDQAVVLMDLATEGRIREDHPDLSIELDVQHRLASGR
jgi:hypothetical protein